MGNSVSAHIYETKVFRPYPAILYRIVFRLDPSIHWWKKIGVPRILYRLKLDPSIHWWKKIGVLGKTKFGVLGGKATVLVYMHDQIPI